MVFIQPCPRPLSRELILSLFTFRRRPTTGMRALVSTLGCVGSRRGCRAGKLSRDVNNIATRAPAVIPVVIGRRQLIAAGNTNAARPAPVLTTIRRHGNLDPVTVGVFNARSIHNKNTSVAQWIADRNLSIACLVETWHDSHGCPNLIACAPTGYNYIDRPRPRTESTCASLRTNHGGVALFHRVSLHAREVALPEYKSFEHVSASLQCPSFSSLVIVIYRPGSVAASDAFFDDFADILERVVSYANLLIAGDVNIHLDDTTDARTGKFRHLLAVHNLTQHVTVPTHTQSHTLDIFVTRTEQKVEHISVDPPLLSDHSQIVGALAKRVPHPHTGTRQVRRHWRALDVDSFRRDLLQSSLVNDPPADVDDLFTCYNDVLRSLVDKHVPAKSVVIRRRPQSPWFDGECREMKRNTRRLERIYRTARTDASCADWRTQFDKQRAFFEAKYAAYWSSTIAENRHDSKLLWSKVNVLLRPPTAPTTSTHTVDDFANFFVGKVEKIRQATAGAPPAVIETRHVAPFSHFSPVTIKEVVDLLAVVPAKCCSLDPLPTWMVKQLKDVFAPIFCTLCNSSLLSGVMPACQKHAIVSPRVKKPGMDPASLSSYRPISNLSFLSKLVERVATARFVRHAEDNKLFPVRQSSYRRGHSTETAVLCVHNDLVRAIDEQRITGLVMLDLSAAFDTVDHSILLSVLEKRFGVSDVTLAWFRSYLSDRTQTFCLNGTSSDQLSVSCSVPQGSSAGPVEFIAYTEDVSNVFNQNGVHYHLYADDKQAYVDTSVKDVPIARATLRNCIIDVSDWCSSRRLQLNETKTELIWFGSTKNLDKVPDSELSLTVGTTTIQPVKSVRDLGVQLDSELAMKTHVSKVASSCFYQLRRLRQIRRLVGQEVTAQLVSAFVLSRLDYCNSVLAGLPRSTIDPLRRVLNAAARLVLNLRLRDHATPALKQLHWLPIESRITYKLCLIMHFVHVDQAPPYLADCVRTVAESTSRPGLRSADTAAYAKPSTRTKFGERGFRFAGPAAWNSLPNELHHITETGRFKRRLKTVLFEQAYCR